MNPFVKKVMAEMSESKKKSRRGGPSKKSKDASQQLYNALASEELSDEERQHLIEHLIEFYVSENF